MGRRFFTFLSALSLLLCVAVCVLWVRQPDPRNGYYLIALHWKGQLWGVAHANGRLLLTDFLQQEEDRRQIDLEQRRVREARDRLVHEFQRLADRLPDPSEELARQRRRAVLMKELV